MTANILVWFVSIIVAIYAGFLIRNMFNLRNQFVRSAWLVLRLLADNEEMRGREIIDMLQQGSMGLIILSRVQLYEVLNLLSQQGMIVKTIDSSGSWETIVLKITDSGNNCLSQVVHEIKSECEQRELSHETL